MQKKTWDAKYVLRFAPHNHVFWKKKQRKIRVRSTATDILYSKRDKNNERKNKDNSGRYKV